MKLSIFTFIAIIMTLLASVAESIDNESKSRMMLRKKINELSEDSAKPSQDQRELWSSTWSRSWTWKSWDNDDDDWTSSKSTKSSKSSKSWSSSWSKDDDDWSSTSKSTKSTSKSSKSWNGDDDWRI